MSRSPRFNYIITIHNKEHMIEQVIMNVLMCCRDNSHVYPVIDGCTDKTEEIIDRIISTFSGVPITKVHTADVHEILSINAGLRAASQDGDGFNIILQDDVLLADFMLESKVVALYNFDSSLGILSFRLGANFCPGAVLSGEAVPFESYIENAYGHGLNSSQMLLPGYLAYRTIPIKSPICLPFKLVRSVGVLEEKLAPYMHDDTEYAIRSINAGYRNAVFGVRFYSDLGWGGTRTNPHPEMAKYTERNMNIIRGLYSFELTNICKSIQDNEVIKVPNMFSEDEDELGIEVWNKNREKLAKYQSINSLSKIKCAIKKFIAKK